MPSSNRRDLRPRVRLASLFSRTASGFAPSGFALIGFALIGFALLCFAQIFFAKIFFAKIGGGVPGLWPPVGEVTAAERSGPAPPNILVIHPDQWRAQALGLDGVGDPNLVDPDTGLSLTPNLDALARDGVRFTRCNAANPLCGPNRAAVLTGIFPHKLGVGKNGRMMRRDAVGIAEVTRAAGYATGYTGKWNLNRGLYHEEAIGDGFVSPGGNRRHGFDVFLGTNNGHRHRLFHYFLDAPIKILPNPTDILEPEWQTRMAIRFITQNRDRPFHMQISYGPPHVPRGEDIVPAEFWNSIDEDALIPRPNVPAFDDPEEWQHDPCPDVEDIEACWRSEMHGYYSSIVWIDNLVGRLVAHLDSEGLLDNTIIVFTSDHGEEGGSHGRYFKTSPFAESLLVPLIIHWPAGIDLAAEDRTTDALISTVDIPSTILGLIGTSFPLPVDGRDFAPWLTGSGPPPTLPHGLIYSQCRLHKIDDKSWRAAYTEDDKFLVYTPNTRQVINFYDMAVDPYQMNNLAGQGLPEELETLQRLEAARWDLGESVPTAEFPPDTTTDIDPTIVPKAEDPPRVFRLSWMAAMSRAGGHVSRYRVYFGDEVPQSDSDWDRIETVSDTWLKIKPRDLEPRTTYYWKVGAIDHGNFGEIRFSRTFSFSTTLAFAATDATSMTPGTTSQPVPADASGDVSSVDRLTWEGGSRATHYRIYFGTNDPPPFAGEQADLIFRPAMAPLTTYYWRVDAVNGAGTTEGEVWSFTTQP